MTLEVAQQEELSENIVNDNGTGIEPEDIESEQMITSPFDPALISVNTKPMTIDLLIKRMQEGEIQLAPDFQRQGGIWDDGAQSRLIESLLIRIPLPAFYFDATNDEEWIVVDGLQRLTTLKRFVIAKAFALKKLDFLTEYENKKYDELPRSLQRRINETQVTVYLIEKGTPPKVKFTLFKRINTGGLPLSTQEIRHALNQGEATKLLVKLSKSTEFRIATVNSIRDERMADRECVLRFLAFTISSPDSYKEDLDNFLNVAMETLNLMNPAQLSNLETRFLCAMKTASEIFGKNAFRRPSQSGGHSPISKALYEVWAVNLAALTNSQTKLLIERKDTVNSSFLELLKEREFDNAISQSTGVTRKVKYRFKAIQKLIEEVLK